MFGKLLTLITVLMAKHYAAWMQAVPKTSRIWRAGVVSWRPSTEQCTNISFTSTAYYREWATFDVQLHIWYMSYVSCTAIRN